MTGFNSWDFFIAHASADTETAEALYELLTPYSSVFLDARTLAPGDSWDHELPVAQRDSLISVILISANTQGAYYQREEIAAAISLVRDEDKVHSVVPVYISPPAEKDERPYGLARIQGLDARDDAGLELVADKLLKLRNRVRGYGRWQGRNRKGLQRQRLAGSGVAILAVVSVALSIGYPRGQPNDRGQTPTPLGSPATPLSPRTNCVRTAAALSPNVIPHYLLNSVGSANFPYWLKIVATNDCPDKKFLTVKFERGASGISMEKQGIPVTIASGQTVAQTFRPEFELASSETGSVRIQWSFEDGKATKVHDGFIDTEIVPPHTIAWDLEKPKAPESREPVEQAYLLASLAAWTQRPPPIVKNRGKKCRASPDGGHRTGEEAIAACYGELFSGDGAIRVLAQPIHFPKGTRQKIRPNATVVREGWATPLEAALLLAAVFEGTRVDGVDPNLVMFVSPIESGAPDQKGVSIAWKDEGRPWRAIDLMHASKKGFDANVSEATGHIDLILRFNSRIRTAIASEGPGAGAGASEDGTVMAVNFQKGATRYKIRAPP